MFDDDNEKIKRSAREQADIFSQLAAGHPQELFKVWLYYTTVTFNLTAQLIRVGPDSGDILLELDGRQAREREMLAELVRQSEPTFEKKLH